MKLAFKKILVNLLVLAVMMLPLRAMSMPIDMSADHCMNGDMSSMQHEGHQMPSVNTDEQVSNCNCCEQCVGDCTDCASMSVVAFDMPQFSETKPHEIFSITADLLFTHITSPPSRPPLLLHI